MTDQQELDLGNCQCCDNEPAVGVASVPGVPMSIAWGQECLRRHAFPLFVADAQVSLLCDPDAPSWDSMADWFREQETFVNGEYVRMDTLPLEVIDCEQDHPKDESCPGCDKGRRVAIKVSAPEKADGQMGTD